MYVRIINRKRVMCMIMEGNISIRTIERDDLKTIYRWNSQEIRGDFQEFKFQSLNELERDYNKSGFCSDEFQVLMIKEEEHKIGLVYLSFYREGIVKIGMVLIPNSCNRGKGTTILKMIIKYLFSNYPIVRVEADTDVKNIAAQKILEKAGFLKEGILRKYRFHHGKYNDSYIYSFINEKF